MFYINFQGLHFETITIREVKIVRKPFLKNQF